MQNYRVVFQRGEGYNLFLSECSYKDRALSCVNVSVAAITNNHWQILYVGLIVLCCLALNGKLQYVDRTLLCIVGQIYDATVR